MCSSRWASCRGGSRRIPNRKTWTLPEVFSPADEALYYSNQFVFRTRDRGKTWEKISPDLTRDAARGAEDAGSRDGEGYR